MTLKTNQSSGSMNVFLNTQIPCCLWFLTNDKTKNGRDRRKETLFIDARNLGTMETRILKVLKKDDIKKIADTVSFWRHNKGYKDVKGYCKSSTTKHIANNNFTLSPARYVGLADKVDDGIPFDEKIKSLTKRLSDLTLESSDLNKKIKKNLFKIGYE